MMQGWVKVVSNRELSPLNYRLVLNAPQIARRAKPGQFLQIGAAECLLKRPFSVCDTAGSKVVVLYKVVGKGTAALSRLIKGDSVDVIGPLGNSFGDAPDWFHRIYVGGGVGVPPLYFLAKRLKSKRKNDRVFIGARGKCDLLYVKEFKKLGLPVATATEDGSAGQRGFVTAPFGAWLNAMPEQDRKHSVVYTCGPKAMMKAVAQISHEAGVLCMASLEEVMGCGLGVCMGCVVKVKRDADFFYERVCTDGPVMDTAKLIWD